MMKPQHILTAIITACAAGISLTAYSQDVNPTVEVSRAYRAKHIAVDKPAMEMPVIFLTPSWTFEIPLRPAILCTRRRISPSARISGQSRSP